MKGQPIKQGPRMLASDASALANVLRRTEDERPSPRDVIAISRALRRAQEDTKRSPHSVLAERLEEALALATKKGWDREAREKFHAAVRSAITILMDGRRADQGIRRAAAGGR